MCYLDAIIGPDPMLMGGTVFLAIAVGVALLCGLVLVSIGFVRAKKEKKREKDHIKDPEI